MTENEFLLADRIAKIQSTINQHGEDNFYLSFSGGKDSTVLSALLDMALPGNKIPRVYANTGIEYKMILEFVNKVKEEEHAWDVVILKPETSIKATLEKNGYPFKSKSHSNWVEKYSRIGRSEGVTQYLGERTDKKPWSTQNSCPAILKYQFTPEFKHLKISDKCCVKLKEEPLKKWAKENKKTWTLTGLMADEGGRRVYSHCIVTRGKNNLFQPLVPLSKDWEDWFINEYNVEICDIYKPPYNFKRTGCKGCPFAKDLQKELDILQSFFPEERKQCEMIWKPVYEEYRRLNYRLKGGKKND